MLDKKGYKQSQAARFWGKEVVNTRNRLKKAFRFFKPFVNRKLPVLDIGTRDGWLTEYLRRKKFANVQGIEITEEAVKYAQSQGRNVIWGDAHDLSAFESEKCGTILMIHSLEHCYDPVKVIKEAHRLLILGGILFIEVPLENKINYEYAHFCNFANLKDLTQVVDHTGFKLLKSRTYCPDPRRHPRLKHLMCAFRKR